MAATDSERQARMKEWNAWFDRMGSAKVDEGAPINAQSSALSSDGNVIPVTGGTTPSGYTILKAGSLDEAVELAKGCPALKHGSEVMVYETFDPMG